MSPPLTTDRVLSTLNADGTRRWIRPRLAHGRFLNRRRVVGYALIALFVSLPLISVGGRPALLLDLVSRELCVFGAVFRPTDGVLLMLLGLGVALTVFLVTALFGRVWCGWGCPQTVYLELVFRPLERLFEGNPARAAKLPRFHPRRIAKWLAYAVLAFGVANVFLAYFVGAARLHAWVLGSPLEHPAGFALVVGVAALMLFDFGWFREQTCIVACPYGRLQSVLLDRRSLIVGYDAARGEPRAKPRKHLTVLGEAAGPAGACVDCGACVSVCPTGIDIREGLQMECIGCAQCVDACDTVMDKLHAPRGLIGYTSADRLAGKRGRLLRARTIVYPSLLAVVATIFVWSVGARAPARVAVLRTNGASFVRLPDGRVAANARIKIENATDAPRTYTLALGDARATLETPAAWDVPARRSIEVPLVVECAAREFANGTLHIPVTVTGDDGFHTTVDVDLLGPASEVSP